MPACGSLRSWGVAQEWLDLDRATRREDDPHRTITDTDLDQRPDDHQQAQTANGHPRDERAAERDRAPADDPPLAETDIPDVRDVAAETPRAVDEDTVHTPNPDEFAEIDALARRAQLEMRNRAALEAQHAADERAEQLARWHRDDAIQETDDTADDAAADDAAQDTDTAADHAVDNA